MSTLMLVNPRRKTRRHRRNPESRRTRIAAARKGWAHRRRHRSNPRHRVHHYRARAHRRMYRMNPRRSRRGARGMRGMRGMRGFVNQTLMPGLTGAGGALALNLALGYLPLPAALNTNLIKPVVGLAGAGLIGWLGSMAFGRRWGEQAAAGAAVVVIYGVAKGLLQTMAPTLPLSGTQHVGWVNPGVNVGARKVGAYTGMAMPRMAVVQPMGAYTGAEVY